MKVLSLMMMLMVPLMVMTIGLKDTLCVRESQSRSTLVPRIVSKGCLGMRPGLKHQCFYKV